MMKANFLALLLLIPAPAFSAPSCEEIRPLEKSREACADFDTHPGFQHAPSIQEAKKACLAFYAQGWEANLSLCKFSAHVKALQKSYASAKKGKQESLAARDLEIRAKYKKEFQERYAKTNELAHAYQVKIGHLNTDGHVQSTAELGCTFSRNRTVPGPVAGMVLMGLATKAHLDLFVNRPNILSAIRLGAKALHQSNGHKPAASLAIQLDEPGAGPTRSDKEIPIPEAPEDPTPDSTHTFWALSSIAQYYTEHYGDEYLSIWAKQFFRAHPKLFKKVPWLVKKFPEYAGTIAAAGLGVGLQYLVHGKVGTLELVSIGVTAYSFGAGLFVDLAIGAYRDTQDRRREYAEFVKEHLDDHPATSSGAMAVLWGKEKKKPCVIQNDPFAGKEKPAAEKPAAGDDEHEEEEEE